MRKNLFLSSLTLALTIAGAAIWRPGLPDPVADGAQHHRITVRSDQRAALRFLERGRRTFRFDTLGSETFFGDALQLHEAVATVSPATALAVGLKVDLEALPQAVVDALVAGAVDLDDPAVTLLLLQLDAVVGVDGHFDDDGNFTSIGITCALCHSTVDNALVPGIGKRLDGWANRDLNVGAIIGLAPNLQPIADLLGVDVATVQAVLASWGPGRFDAHLNLDGKAFRPDGETGAVLIPPAFGQAGMNLHTYNGWGSTTYWNAFVGNLEMNGTGRFYDPRLDDPVKFPIAAANGFGDRDVRPDRITRKLPALHFYQLSLEPPRPPLGSFDRDLARQGSRVFRRAGCDRCHVPPLYTEPGWNLHDPEEIGIDSFQAERGPEDKYRTTPLRGLWTHTAGGFYHDGRFATLGDVIDHYDDHFTLGLSSDDKAALAEFLMSL